MNLLERFSSLNLRGSRDLRLLTRRSLEPRIGGGRNLVLTFPREIDTPINKVLYALWHDGDQCYCNLHLRTGLTTSELKRALKFLIDEEHQVIRMSDPPGKGSEVRARYRLAS